MFLVYQIIFPNNKVYIGRTKDLNRRITLHKYDAKRGIKTKLYNAMRKYGNEWSVVILEYCKSFKDVCEMERNLIEEYDSIDNGYNSTEGGEGGGSTHSYKPTRRTINKLKTARGNSARYSHSYKITDMNDNSFIIKNLANWARIKGLPSVKNLYSIANNQYGFKTYYGFKVEKL